MSDNTGRLSGEQISRIVGVIYDCVLAPDRWNQAVDMMRAELNFANGMLSSLSTVPGEYAVGGWSGMSPYWLARMQEFADAVPDLWGGQERLWRFPLEEPILNSHINDPDTLRRNRYFLGWAEPQGLTDAVAIALERDNGLLANIGFSQHRSAGPVGDPVLDDLRLLAPHLRRAVNLSRILEAQRVEASSFAAIVEAHRAGVVMVDDAMCVLHANKAAHAMLAAGHPIKVRQGRLVAADDAAERALRASVARAATNEALLGNRSGMGIGFRGRSGEACIVHVLPLRRRSNVPDAAKQAVVALFITQDNRSLTPMPSQVLDTLYDLTPAETRVFDLIVDGCTQTEVAARIGIALSTVKTHLLRVFEKTGTRRQADLVNLARSLAIPL